MTPALGSMLAAAFTVLWNGAKVEQSPARISAMPFNRVWTGKQRTLDQTKTARFVSIDADRAGLLEVAFETAAPQAEIFPLSLRKSLMRKDRAVRVAVDRPRHFVLDFGDAAETLHVFVNPPLAACPTEGKVRRFGRGVHEAGVIVPESGETIYLDEGAVVKAAVFVDRAENVRITGRGVFDFSGFERCDARISAVRQARGHAAVDTEFACGAFVVNASTNVVVEGVILRDAPFWNCIVRGQSRDVVVDNIKVIGAWRYNSDGIDVAGCENVTVRNCFVRSFDDSLVVLDGYLDDRAEDTRNIRLENNVLWCDWGANFKLWGGKFSGVTENVVLRDCVFAKTCGKPIMIRSHLGCKRWKAQNVTIENLELDYPGPNVASRLQKSDEDRFVRTYNPTVELYAITLGWPVTDTGNQGRRRMSEREAAATTKAVENVSFRNISIVGATPELVAYEQTGGPNQSIRKVTRENVRIVEGTEDAGREALLPVKRILWQKDNP